MKRIIISSDPMVSDSINKTVHKIKVINKSSFSIGDTSIYTEFIRNGIVKIVKVPIPVKFQPLENILALKT